MSALTTLEMDLDCTHKESIKKAYIHSSVTRCSMMIYKKRIYKTTIQTAGVYPKQQGTKIYLLFVWSKEKRSEESAFFPRKYLKKSKINKISDFPTKKESNQWRKHRENHHLHPQRDRLSLSLSVSLARGGSSSNKLWSTRKGKNRAKKHPRSSKLRHSLAFSPREKKKKKKKRRNDSSSLRLFFFWLLSRVVTKNLSSSSFEINLQNARCETKFVPEPWWPWGRRRTRFVE